MVGDFQRIPRYCSHAVLPVFPGDKLSLVQSTRHGFLCKKEGVTGWYYGRISDIMNVDIKK